MAVVVTLRQPGLIDVMESSDDVEEYDGQLVVKRDKKEKRSPSPVDKNKLPPIQVLIYWSDEIFQQKPNVISIECFWRWK